MNRISRLASVLVIGLLATVSAAQAGNSSSSTNEVVQSTVSGLVTTWHITRPVITQKDKSYTKIKYEQGDIITIEAGGCDQTGGFGATWKRYVDPQGDNADRLYHGLIYMPGVTNKFKASPSGPKGYVRFLDMGLKNISTGQFKGTFVVGDLTKVAEKDRYVRLGFEDDNYGDNGYTGRDNGTGNQCQNLGTSYVIITVNRKKHRLPNDVNTKKVTAAEKSASN
jgi:hypothetical protein